MKSIYYSVSNTLINCVLLLFSSQQLATKIAKAKTENKSKEKIGELKELFAEERAKTINLFQARQILLGSGKKENKWEKVEKGREINGRIENKKRLHTGENIFSHYQNSNFLL